MKKGRLFFLAIILVFFANFFTSITHAESNYVLPYPSAMPGSVLYKLHIILDFVSRYWYFGNFGQFTYNLKQTDRYIVETKTLFEYKQYLLGMKSLEKSNFYIVNTLPYLLRAKAEHKDINSNRNILKEDALRQIEMLTKLGKDVPRVFVWTPEKSPSTTLELKKTIDQAISIREKYL